MPFVRYDRDKRGYEQIWLMHAPVRRGRPSRARVLYWYRSPPGVRVGREVFDAAARAQLEAQYPDVGFDWDTLAAAAMIPPLEVEPWRERRRAQREARRGRAPADEAALREAAADSPGDTTGEPFGAGIEAGPPETDTTAQPTEPRPRRRGRRRRRRVDAPGTSGAQGAEAAVEPPSASAPTPDPTERTTPSSDS